MSIRLLKKRDTGEYRRLRLEALQKAPSAFGSSYAEEKKMPLSVFTERLTSKDIWVFGAFAKGRLVGILGLIRESRVKRSHHATLVGMYVSTAFRKQGLGAALVDEAIAHARKLATIRYIKLSLTGSNEAARSLYLSRGFRTFGLEREALLVDGDYLDEEYMALKISAAHKKATGRRSFTE
jgi:ribosomal protein S18 acetylase RimI-like enzyme